jgi:hypothetical protein
MNQHLKLADLEIPKDLWSMSDEKRREITLTVKFFLEGLIKRQLGVRVNKQKFLKQLIESTIIVNEEQQNYEICQVMKDVKQLLDEPIG